VTIIVADDHADSLVHRLPPGVRQAIVGEGRLRLRVPGHPMLADCMRMLAGPVVLAEPGGADDSPPVTAAEVVARCEAAGAAVSLVIDDGRVEADLACMLGLELAELEVDHDEATQLQVVEQQVDVELPLARGEPMLAADERKSAAKLEQAVRSAPKARPSPPADTRWTSFKVLSRHRTE
jgi:hypothetical protein